VNLKQDDYGANAFPEADAFARPAYPVTNGDRPGQDEKRQHIAGLPAENAYTNQVAAQGRPIPPLEDA
jgi:hypothetical protein